MYLHFFHSFILVTSLHPSLPFFCPLSSRATAYWWVIWQSCQLLQPEWWPRILPTVLHYPASLAHQPEGLTLRRREPISREAHGLNYFHPFVLLLIRLQRQHQQCQQHWHGWGGDPGHQSLPKPIYKHRRRAHRTATDPHPAAKICMVLSSKEVCAGTIHHSDSFLLMRVFVFVFSTLSALWLMKEWLVYKPQVSCLIK